MIDLVQQTAERLADLALAPPTEILTPAEARAALIADLSRALVAQLGPARDLAWANATLGYILQHLEVHRGQCGACDRWIRGHGGTS